MSVRTIHRRMAAAEVVIALAVALLAMRSALGETGSPITIRADYGQHWKNGGSPMWVLRGRCRVVQGETRLGAQKMVIWQKGSSHNGESPAQLTIYLEGDARVDRPGRSARNSSLLVHLKTHAGLEPTIRHLGQGPPAAESALLRRAVRRRKHSAKNGAEDSSKTVSAKDNTGPPFRRVQIEQPAGRNRRIRIFPRSAVPYNVESFRSEETTPPQQVWLLTKGVNVLIEGTRQAGTIDLAADRIIIWTEVSETGEFQAETLQSRDTPLEIYLEGNIVIRQGTNVLRASRAYYNVRQDRALMLDAELKAFVPQLRGTLRVRAERLRQLSRKSYHATNAWATTSSFGKPGYRIQASDIFLDYRPGNPWLGIGETTVDPVTGVPVAEEVPWVTSLNNTFLLDESPLLYTPFLSGPADDPNIPLRRVRVGQDSIFGGQLETVWNVSSLFGTQIPEGVEWNLLADVFTERGPAIGTQADYEGGNLFGHSGSYSGEGLGYYIRDEGRDNLGRGRRSLEPERHNRGRIFLRHRHRLPGDFQLFGEVGFLSDRNVLEQYYEDEFDEDKDNETLLYLKRNRDNRAIGLLVRPQVNDFAATTEWLPRGDLYVLSEPFFGGRVTWSTHTSAGFGIIQRGDRPNNPNDLFTRLPYLADAEGAVLMSRHELNVPLNLGPLRLVPYAMGEAAYWGEGFRGNSVDRFVGTGGVRSSLLFWRVFPDVRSRTFNLHGLAHKIVFGADYAITDSSENLANIPQFNQFDDNAQERFRRRLLVNTFGGTLPATFTPRFYAVRTGAGQSVTAPYHELIDDQQVFRLRMRHRLQTKVGPPQRRRIIDWMTWETGLSIFPDENRDNFGRDVGLINSRYEWRLSERTRILAGALYDPFNNGQELWDLGVLSQRSRRGSIYFGLRQVKGAAGLDSQILTASYSYKMSPKWVSTFGTAFDVAEERNRGQSLTLTRIGADFLVHLGASFDESKNNAGLAISIEPRFGALQNSPTQLSSLLGIQPAADFR